MEVTFGQYLAHGVGGGFKRWFEEAQFRYQQCVSQLGGDDFECLHIDLMMPGPQGEFGEPGLSIRLQQEKRQIRAELRLDPATYGAAESAEERIGFLFEGLADLTKQLCVELKKPEIAEDFWTRVYILQYEVLGEAR